MSLPKKIQGLHLSCQQGSFPCISLSTSKFATAIYGVLPNGSGSCTVFELVCVNDHLAYAHGFSRWDASWRSGFALRGRFWPRRIM